MAIPTVTPIILEHHIKDDGSVKVKIRLTHNRRSRYLPTTEVAHKGDYTKDLVIKNNAMLLRLTTLIEKIENAIKTIDLFNLPKMSVGELADYIERKLQSEEKFELDFFQFGREILQGRKRGSVCNYFSAMSSFSNYLGRETLDISEITSSMLRSFEDHLIKKHGKDARAVTSYTSGISYIHKQARLKYNNEELDEVRIKNPYLYYTPPKQKPTQKRALSAEAIQKLIDIRGCLSEYYKLAVDTFLLSFCLMGTNIPDIYEATREDDIIYYNRMKTRDRRIDKAEMRIRLEPECKCIWEGLLDPKNKRAFVYHKKYTSYASIADKGNDRLQKVAELIGEKPFTMYAARHSFASIAYSLGIAKSLINDCLCHVDPDMAVTDIYIKKDWNVLWEANKKVIQHFDWK